MNDYFWMVLAVAVIFAILFAIVFIRWLNRRPNSQLMQTQLGSTRISTYVFASVLAVLWTSIAFIGMGGLEFVVVTMFVGGVIIFVFGYIAFFALVWLFHYLLWNQRTKIVIGGVVGFSLVLLIFMVARVGLDSPVFRDPSGPRISQVDTTNAIKEFSRPTPLQVWNSKVSWSYTKSAYYFQGDYPPTEELGAKACQSELRDNEFSSCAIDLSLGFRDPKLCELYALPKPGDSEYSGTWSWLGHCMTSFAELYNRYDCLIHTNIGYRDICHYTFATINLNFHRKTGDCSKIVDSSVKEKCQAK